MNLTDILILVGILVFMALGFRDGFLKKVFGAIGFLGGFVLGVKFMGVLGLRFVDWFGLSEDEGFILAFLCIFILVTLLMNLFYRWFGRSSSESLKPASRIAGTVLGGAQGVVAVSLILLMCNAFDMPDDSSREESALYPDMIQIAPDVFDYSTQWLPDSKHFVEETKGKLNLSKILQ